jgi:hypothetical protein
MHSHTPSKHPQPRGHIWSAQALLPSAQSPAQTSSEASISTNGTSHIVKSNHYGANKLQETKKFNKRRSLYLRFALFCEES